MDPNHIGPSFAAADKILDIYRRDKRVAAALNGVDSVTASKMRTAVAEVVALAMHRAVEEAHPAFVQDEEEL